MTDRLRKKEDHTEAELFHASQAYYRISQLHAELKFIDKAQDYMKQYEKLQEEYLKEISKVKNTENIIQGEFLKHQLLKRKAWLSHNACDDDQALSTLSDVYSSERK